MACSLLRRWYCWALLLCLGQGLLLVTSALLHVLYFSRAPELEAPGGAVVGEDAAPGPARGSVPLLRPWAWKYGVGVHRAASRPEAWVMCPGNLKRRHMEALKPKIGSSYVISLNRYFHPPVFEQYGLMPTHHWHYAPEHALNGYCLKELKNGQKGHAHKPRLDPTKKTVLKFAPGYGECYVAQEAALAASNAKIPFIGPRPLIKLLRTLGVPSLDPYLHDEGDWLEDHPLPIDLDDLSLLHGIGIAVSLTPQGSIIKLAGCTGFNGKKDIKGQAKRVREKIRMLQNAGPGWDVVNCDPKSEYVKLGAMPGISCIDSRDSEYDLEKGDGFAG